MYYLIVDFYLYKQTFQKYFISRHIKLNHLVDDILIYKFFIK